MPVPALDLTTSLRGDFSTIQWKVWDLTNEQTLLVNKRQLDNWAKSIDKVEGMVLAHTSKRITGGGRRVLYQKCHVALYQWFSARCAQNLPVSARMLNDETQQLAKSGGHILSRRWLEKFQKRHHIVLRKAQRRTQLSAAERDSILNQLYTYLYLQPFAIEVWVNLDEIPAALAGLLGNVQTLEHKGSLNVMVSFKENHFKRMGTLIAMLAIGGAEGVPRVGVYRPYEGQIMRSFPISAPCCASW